MQSSRVWVTISMIVATPRPSSPSSRAGAPRNSTSLEASERVPSLSFSRCSSKPGPRSTTKHERPPGAWARTRKTAPIGCEQNHLWPVSSKRPSPAGSARRRAGPDVRAALLLGHRHAAQRAALVVGQRQPRLPLRRQLGIRAQRRDRGVGHRDRAHHARVRLRPQQLERRAGDVRARPRLAPRQRVDLALDRAAQQPVPARVVLDAVDPVPVAVVRLQPRRVALGAAAVLLRLGGARRRRRSRARGRRPSRRPRAPAPRAARGRRRSS